MTLRQYTFFICGQLGVMLQARFLFQWILDFASRETGGSRELPILLFPPVVVGLVLLGFRIFDAVTDPIAGALSDSCVAKGTARQKLLLWWFWVPGLGLALCFLPAAEMAEEIRWTLLIAGMLIFFLGYTFYAIPYWSLVEDYSQGNQAVRRRLSNLLGAGLMLATAAGFILTPAIISSLGFSQASIVVALVSSLLMLLPFWAAPEKRATVSLEGAPQFSCETILAALRDRSFLAICLLYIASQMSLTVMTSAAPFIATVLNGGTEKDVAHLMGPLLVFAFITFLFVPKISSLLSYKRAAIFATIALVFVYVLGVFLGSSLLPPPATSSVFVFALAGPFIAILLGVEGEAIAAAAAQQNPGATSSYFGVFNLLVKTANGVAIFLMGFLVEQARGPTGQSAVRGMLGLALLTLVLGLAAFFLLSRRKQGAEQPALTPTK